MRGLTQRENLNAKIEVCLELFDQLNVELGEKKNELTPFYDDVKNNMVKVLNEIVENYVYRDPKKPAYDGGLTRAGADLRRTQKGERRAQDGARGRGQAEAAAELFE